MERIGVDPNTLREEARTYERACDAIDQARVDIEATNARMEGHWNGAAFKGYLDQYEQVLKPAILEYNRVMQECCAQVKSYADFVEQNDQEAARQFRSTM